MAIESTTGRISALLHEAAETHHRVYRLTEGEDPDSASWYASWLVRLSELPELVKVQPVRSHLVHFLVQVDRDYTLAAPSERWEDWYAERLEQWCAQDADTAGDGVIGHDQ